MNKVDLFDIKSVAVEGAKIFAILNINAQSDIYKAHFPNNPITPGVTEIYFVKKVLEAAFPNKTFTFQFSKQIKFVEVLRPAITEVNVEIATLIEEDYLIADVEIKKGNTTFLKAKLTYKISE